MARLFAKRGANEERPEQPRASCEGDGVEVRHLDACLAQGFADGRDDVLLMGAGSEFRHHASVCRVYVLA